MQQSCQKNRVNVLSSFWELGLMGSSKHVLVFSTLWEADNWWETNNKQTPLQG